MQNCLMTLELPALCQIGFDIYRVEVISEDYYLRGQNTLAFSAASYSYNNREKLLLC